MALTPVGCEPEWRIALLTAVLALSAALTMSLVPAPARYAPLAALLLFASLEWCVLVSRNALPRRLRLTSDGRLAVTIGVGEMPAALLPDSLFAQQFAWLHWRAAGSRRAHWTLLRRRDNPAMWRRARLIWRWAPRSRARGPLV